MHVFACDIEAQLLCWFVCVAGIPVEGHVSEAGGVDEVDIVGSVDVLMLAHMRTCLEDELFPSFRRVLGRRRSFNDEPVRALVRSLLWIRSVGDDVSWFYDERVPFLPLVITFGRYQWLPVHDKADRPGDVDVTTWKCVFRNILPYPQRIPEAIQVAGGERVDRSHLLPRSSQI